MTRKMKTFCKRIVAAASAAVLTLGGVLPGLGTAVIKADAQPTLWIVGDSTVSDFNDSYYIPRKGYGTQIGVYLDGTYTIQNLAQSGTSSKSYLAQSNYEVLKSGIKAGDALIVGFGHNDEKYEDSSRYTSPFGTKETEGSFAKSLYDNYVKLAQDKGAEVILCTPVVRRTSNDTFSDQQLHKPQVPDPENAGSMKTGDYPAAIRGLGADVGVPVIDLTKLTQELYLSLGVEGTKELHAFTSRNESSIDNTHLNKYGAMYVAYLLANQLKTSGTTLGSHVKTDITAPNKDEVDYKDETFPDASYSSPTEDSKLFSTYSLTDSEGRSIEFKPTAFGQLGGNPSTANHILTSDNGNMRVACINKKGKITATEDGMVMYYYKVPSTSKFTISAVAKINGISLDNQVAFGLIARDTMYIDKYEAGIKDDYVVAGSLGKGSNCFYRKSNALGGQGTLTKSSLNVGDSYKLSISFNGEGFTCQFGDETPMSAGYDYMLNSVDSEYVYIGMFASRNADITYSQIYLEVDGTTIIDATEKPHTVTVSPKEEGTGTVTASKTTALAGEEVKLTPQAADGYAFQTWEIVSPEELIITDNKFTMPDKDVVINGVFKGLRTAWDFQDDIVKNRVEHATIQGQNDVEWNGLTISTTGVVDGCTGKFNTSNISSTAKWAQVNKGTKIEFPIIGNCRVAFEFYNASYQVNGTDATAASQSFVCDGSNEKISVIVTGNNYLSSINITPIEYVEEGTYSFNDKTLTASDVTISGIIYNNIKNDQLSTGHGLYTSGSNSSIILSLSEKANVYVTTCCFNNGDGIKLTASSGTVSSEKTSEISGDKVGLKYSIAKADKGDLTVTIDKANTYIHSIVVEYIRPKVFENQKIDVWDFDAKSQTDTDTEKYNNNITIDSWLNYNEKFAVNASQGGNITTLTSNNFEFGDLILHSADKDRLYSGNTELSGMGNSPSSFGTSIASFDDYTSTGAFYCGGAGSSSKRYLEIKNVQAGDRIIAYVGNSGNATTFSYECGNDKQSISVDKSKTGKLDFVAKSNGTYKIYEGSTGKPMYYRVVRIPGVNIAGSIDMGEYSGSGYSLKFIEDETGNVVEAEVENGEFSAVLTAGCNYTAALSGASGWAITPETKKISISISDVYSGKTGIELKVFQQETYTYSGKITGFAEGYNLDNFIMKLIPSDTTSDKVNATVDKSALTFTAELLPSEKYTWDMSGVDDYEVKNNTEISNSSGDNITDVTVTVELKPMYKVTGALLNVKPEDVKELTLIYVNEEDKESGYSYNATVNADGTYSISLRDGIYRASADCSSATTTTHVIVDGGDVSRDLFFVVNPSQSSLPRVSDIYVGYSDKENNYTTVKEAIEACKAMNPTCEDERVTVHVAPGTYRQQIIIDTPYISIVNDTDEEVKITWYYGIGYKYYSAKGGYYNAASAFDKFYKYSVDRWGATVRVTTKATAFRAKGITFENSFNRYITEEELSDKVEWDGSSIKFDRTPGIDVQSKAATERAAAMALEADLSEFDSCKFFSSQDTLYTQGQHSYFKNCLIEGQTDYIFGRGNVVFDACELSFKGYSAGSQGGYITASRPLAGEYGYLFRNCVITGNDKLTVTPGYLGRPWGADAKVYFMNTKFQNDSIITKAGWHDMSSAKAADANFFEYNSKTLSGDAIDTSGRVRGVMSDTEAALVDVKKFFGSWTPSIYQEETADIISFDKKPFITDNGDLNTPYPGHTLTVGYSIKGISEDNDASTIKWYRVKGDEETLIYASNAVKGKTYKITKQDIGYQIKVVVTPETITGKVGTEASSTVEEAVKEGYEEPGASGSDAILGDGVNIFLVGDSTVRDYSASGIWSNGAARNEGAWGEFLQGYFDKEKITVVNYANGGRSSRNFINEGSLDKVAAKLKDGDYLLIQFGHNDCANGSSYLVDRYVPLGEPDNNGIYPTTPGEKVTAPSEFNGKYGSECYTYDCGGTYKWYLLQYIEAARNAGAIPVLVTPVSRMYYNSDGTIKPHHDSTDTTTGTYVSSNNAYVTAVKQLAEEQNVLLIDGFELTKSMFEDAFKAAGNKDYGTQIMNTGDSTHNNKLGGMIEAALIAGAIQNMNLNISYAVKAPVNVAGMTTDGKVVFNVDSQGAITAYDINSEYENRADYWEGIGAQMFSSIANKAKELEESLNGSGEEKPEKYNVSGKITDKEEKPLSGVKVTLINGTSVVGEATTDADGAYSISGVKGSYKLEIKLDGYTTVEKNVVIDSVEVEVETIKMDKASGTHTPDKPGEEVPTQPDTPKPTEPDTEAPTEPDTEAPTEPDTEAPTEPETESPTRPSSEDVTKPTYISEQISISSSNKKAEEAPDVEVAIPNKKAEEAIISLLSNEEKAEIRANGEKIKLHLTVDLVDEKKAEKEVAKVKESSIVKEEKYQIGTYLDLSLTIANLNKSVTEIAEPISITVKLDEKLINRNANVTRIYNVVRVHKNADGTMSTDILPASFNETTGEIVFDTDRFSTYAVVYKDIDKTANASATIATSAKTGDANRVLIFLVIAMLSAAVSIVAVKKIRA